MEKIHRDVVGGALIVLLVARGAGDAGDELVLHGRSRAPGGEVCMAILTGVRKSIGRMTGRRRRVGGVEFVGVTRKTACSGHELMLHLGSRPPAGGYVAILAGGRKAVGDVIGRRGCFRRSIRRLMAAVANGIGPQLAVIEIAALPRGRIVAILAKLREILRDMIRRALVIRLVAGKARRAADELMLHLRAGAP